MGIGPGEAGAVGRFELEFQRHLPLRQDFLDPRQQIAECRHRSAPKSRWRHRGARFCASMPLRIAGSTQIDLVQEFEDGPVAVRIDAKFGQHLQHVRLLRVRFRHGPRRAHGR